MKEESRPRWKTGGMSVTGISEGSGKIYRYDYRKNRGTDKGTRGTEEDSYSFDWSDRLRRRVSYIHFQVACSFHQLHSVVGARWEWKWWEREVGVGMIARVRGITVSLNNQCLCGRRRFAPE